MKKIKLAVYRHKERKDIYLTRNWCICGGSETTDFYKATTSIVEAISNTNGNKEGYNPFESWMSHFIDENGQTKLVVKIKDKKDFEFDGYKGTATKEIVLRVADFEKIILGEVTENE